MIIASNLHCYTSNISFWRIYLKPLSDAGNVGSGVLSIFTASGEIADSTKWWVTDLRSSRPELFCSKSFLRNFAKFTGKHLCQRPFFNKVADLTSGGCFYGFTAIDRRNNHLHKTRFPTHFRYAILHQLFTHFWRFLEWFLFVKCPRTLLSLYFSPFTFWFSPQSPRAPPSTLNILVRELFRLPVLRW